MNNLNERLKEIRVQHGFTMKALCDKTGMPLRTYQNYEAGIREPSLSAIISLADVYNTTTDFLLGRAPQTDPIQLLMAQNVLKPQEIEEQFGFPVYSVVDVYDIIEYLEEELVDALMYCEWIKDYIGRAENV